MDGNMIMMTVAAVLILISSVLYFITTFFGNAKKQSSSSKENPNSQNELVTELKKQNALIQSRMENLEREIRVLSGKQENQVKAIIKYNKENARQLALSERDTLMRVMQELKKTMESNTGSVVMREAPEAAPVREKVSDSELFEVSDLPAEEEVPSLENLLIAEEPTQVAEEISNGLEEAMDPFAAEVSEAAEELDLSSLFTGMAEEEPTPVMEEVSNELEDVMMTEPLSEDLFATEIPETSETPEFSDELDLSALFAEMEKEEIPVLAAEEPKQESAPAADPLAGFGSDPNAMMTPEDIAKLLEAMGQ